MRSTESSTKTFLADTHALIELFGGNEHYKKYEKNILVTTQFNLIELYYFFLREYNERTADHFYNIVEPLIHTFDSHTLKTAASLKHAHHRRKLSYADCVGYAVAAEMNIPFLTGDKQFREMPNVAFVQ